jgi:hypothetical protein
MWPLPIALMIAGALAAISGNRAALVTATVMLVNWLSCVCVVAVTHDFYPVLFFIVADYLAALALFTLRTTRWQSLVMAIYGVQLICHAAYALSDMGAGPTYYSYWALTYLAWAQVALIGGWIGTDFVGRWSAILSGRRIQARAFANSARKKMP